MELTECLHSVLALTINDPEWLRRDNIEKTKQINRMQHEKDVEIAEWRRMIEEMARRMKVGGGDCSEWPRTDLWHISASNAC